MKQSREAWVDWAKTLSIFFVVVGHAGIPYLGTLVYQFHVPAFFVLSGYLYRPHKWYKTLTSFIIPILFFSSLVFIFSCSFYKTDILSMWEKSTWFVFNLNEKRPLFMGLWFLEVLFVSRLLLGDLGFSFVRNNYKILATLSIVLSIVIDIFNIELNCYISRIIQCFPFIGLGIYLKEFDFNKSLFNSHGKSIAFVGGVIFLFLSIFNQKCDIMYNRYNMTYILFYINANIGTLLLFYICRFLKESKTIRYFSTGTLAILGTHVMVLLSCGQSTFKYAGLLAPLISMLIAYPIIRLSLKYCPILIGKFK